MSDYLWHRSIELISISDLCADPKHFVLSVSILSWLVDQIYEREDIDKAELLIDVGFIGKLGKYPAIVIRFLKNTDPSDDDLDQIEEQLIAISEDILATKSVLEFSSHLIKENKDWQKITNDLITKYTDP